jgi:drug/metabolite transporter (DMT)-like permease
VNATSTTRTPPAALVAIAVTVVSWASAFVAIRSTGEHYQPGALALGRLIVGCLALGTLLAVRRSWVSPTRREWLLVMLCGVAWFALYNLALNAAERRVDAGTTAMLVNVGPILIAVFAGLLLGEGFPRWLVIGIAVAFGGAALIGIATTTAGDTDPVGVVLCIAAAVVYAVGVLAQKPALRRLPALQVTWLACATGAVVCLPFAGQLASNLDAAPGSATLGLLYLGLVPMAVAFSTWAYALARMDAGRLGVTVYLVPPITVLLGWLFLDEVPPALALVGGGICLLGVGVSRRRDRRTVTEPVFEEAAT